jgi:hypothetical protein
MLFERLDRLGVSRHAGARSRLSGRLADRRIAPPGEFRFACVATRPRRLRP